MVAFRGGGREPPGRAIWQAPFRWRIVASPRREDPMRMKMTSLAAMVVLASGCATTGTPALRGHYTWGHEVESFRPCGSTQTFWVRGDAAVLQPLRALSAA